VQKKPLLEKRNSFIRQVSQRQEGTSDGSQEEKAIDFELAMQKVDEERKKQV